MIRTKIASLGIAIAFRQARENIASGKEHYICNALYRVEGRGEKAVEEIRSRMYLPVIGVPYTLENWLRETGIISENTHILEDEMRAYRLAWLDALIKEFDPEGETA